MSDDFKKQPPNQPPDDDESLDWLRGVTDEGGKSSDSGFGFTGELQWKQGAGAGDSSEAPADDLLFDWQQASTSDRPGVPNASTGFTGELDWKKASGEEASGGSAHDDPLAWMKDFNLEPEPPSPAASEPTDGTKPVANDDPLTWMKAFDVHMAQTSQLDPRKAPNAAPDSNDPMSWLGNFTPPPSAASSPAAASGSASVDSLAWMKDFEIEQQAEDSADDAPSWLTGADKPSVPGDDLPPWLTGEEGPQSPPTDDDLLGGLDEALGIVPPPARTASVLTTDDVSLDWMTAPKDDMPIVPTPGAENSDLELPDWWDDVGAEPGADLGEIAVSPFPEEMMHYVHGSPAAPPQKPVPEGDIFAQLGLPAVETGYEFVDKDAGAAENKDWFAEDEPPPPSAGTSKPDWLSSLEDMSEIPQAQLPLSAEDDFFAELSATRAEKPAAKESAGLPDFDTYAASGLDDIDKLLASYDTANLLPKAPDTASTADIDLDKLLSDTEMQQINSLRSAERSGLPEGLSPDAPGWLTELGVSHGTVSGTSAAAILRKQADQERPVEELSDRLFALREAGMEMPPEPEAPSSSIIANLLPGVNELIPLTPLHPGAPSISGTFALEESQQKKLDILKTLVAIEDEKPQFSPTSAIDLTLSHPNMGDFVDDTDDMPELDKEPAKPAKPKKVAAPRTRYRFDRLLLALLLTAAVVLPFIVPALRFGDLPPARFAAGSMAAAAYEQVATLRPGQVALVGIEYGPGAAGELDPALDALLRHILLQGARPALIGGDAVGLLHARNVLEQIINDSGFRAQLGRKTMTANRDYYVLRYLPGAALGLRSFAQDVPAWAATDVNGQPTGLRIGQLRDFALVAAVVEHVEDARLWAEQIAPLAAQPPILAVGQSAAPLIQPYAAPSGSLGGLLIGYRDSYTYQSLLDVAMGLATAVPTQDAPATELPTEAPATALPTTLPTESQTLEVTSRPTESGVQGEQTATSAPTETPTLPSTATETPTEVPTATSAPTEAPTVASAQSDQPTATGVPTEAGTADAAVTPASTPDGVQVFAVVDASDLVRVREGAGRSFPAIETLKPGQRVQVIGRTGDSVWIQVRLEDGREGWVSASLLRLETPATPTTSASRIDPYAVVGLDSDVFMLPPLQEATPDVLPEATAEATEVIVTAAAPTPPPAPTPLPPPQTGLPDRDKRWYGMTLGLIAVIAIIALGAVINILRALFRRAS